MTTIVAATMLEGSGDSIREVPIMCSDTLATNEEGTKRTTDKVCSYYDPEGGEHAFIGIAGSMVLYVAMNALFKNYPVDAPPLDFSNVSNVYASVQIIQKLLQEHYGFTPVIDPDGRPSFPAELLIITRSAIFHVPVGMEVSRVSYGAIGSGAKYALGYLQGLMHDQVSIKGNHLEKSIWIAAQFDSKTSESVQSFKV